MSGLSYICGYGDSEEENNSESDSEGQSKQIDSLKSNKIQRLKLPAPNLNNIPSIALDEHIDDPTQHGGRIRSFPHVRGNWATFVYIKYPITEGFSNLLNSFTKAINAADQQSQICQNIHISLSKTFVLKYHMISLFTKSLQEVLDNIESFELGFDSVAVYCNEEQTRTFIALKVDTFSTRYLLKLVAKIDSVLSEFRLPEFYEDPSFHMSVLDINGNKKAEILNILDKLDNIYTQEEANNPTAKIIRVIDCKSGNKNFQYYLK